MSQSTPPTITGADVERYLEQLLPPRDAVMTEMERQAAARSIPIVGPVVGRLLYQLAVVHGARRIFELGSAIGYSTLWWAEAVGAQGEVFYTDIDEQRAAEARQYFRQAGVEEHIRMKIGDALDSFDQTPGSFDLIFIDLEKSDYPAAFRKTLPRLRKGGLLVADNVLWKGKVAVPDPSPETQAILEFNRLIYSSPHLFPVILPVRDGVAVCCKQ